MIHIKNFADSRQTELCAFCAYGKSLLTRDHTPSKILLNKPYPENLHIVYSCEECNKGFSLDEEYIAYWIEIALFKKSNIVTERYKKALRVLEKRPSLKKRILGSNLFGENELLPIEEDKFKNILFKLASGHILYKQNNPQYEKPTSIKWNFLDSFKKIERSLFEETPKMDIFPEIGSRTVIMMNSGEIYYTWEIVQDNIYRYLVANVDNSIIVKLVFSEFIACEITWIP